MFKNLQKYTLEDIFLKLNNYVPLMKPNESRINMCMRQWHKGVILKKKYDRIFDKFILYFKVKSSRI